MKGENFRRVMEEIGEEYVESIKKKINNDTGKLARSVEYQLDADGSLLINANEYYKFQDKGVSGVKVRRNTPYSYSNKKPPIDEISGWSRRKGINEWVLQKSLYEKGFEGKDLGSDFDKILDRNMDKLLSAMWEDFKNDIEE